MQKFKKYLLCLFACCLAFVCAFGAACSEDSSDGDSTGNGSSSSESTSSNSSSSASTSSESSSSESSSSESSSSDSTGDDSDDDDYTLTSTTVYFVGDSTVCEFSDAYYLPRYGYGTQFSNYINSSYVTVTNLALSGRSSKSYISESNYTTLTDSIGTGDYLIIGFGHNDEKSDEAAKYTTPEKDSANTEGTFQYYLYNYYVKMAIDRGATPILCTPIVRYNSSNNYEGSSGHVTSDGDYAACILDLAGDYNITCVDLTSITKTLYSGLQETAKWFHAHTTATIADDGDTMARTINSSDNTTVSVVPSGMDSTHLNMYGAKMVAYQLASALRTARTSCALGYYVLSDITEPTIANDLEGAYNTSYVYSPYSAPTLTSSIGSITDTSESATTYSVYKSAFGDIGGNSTTPFTISQTSGVYTVGSTGTTKGKISSSSEGWAMAFIQLPYNQNFTMTATATVTSAAASATSDTSAVKQSGFGLMIRDDMYIDTYDTNILSNYVAAGMYMSDETTTNIVYSRESSKLTTSVDATTLKSNSVSSAYKVGDTATLTITRTGQSIVATVVYNGTSYSATYNDFDLVAIDGDYMYLGFYATRGTTAEFTNITYTATGTAADA